MTMKRTIIKINEEKCNGCGLCVPACHEGAIQLVDGKAKLVKESYCDGLGACLGDCPQDAITMVEREADAFDPEAVKARLEAEKNKQKAAPAPLPCGCPGTFARSLAKKPESNSGHAPGEQASQLTQWPVQLQLVPVDAPYWEDADLLVAADCVAVAYGGFQKLLQGKKVIIACPKLDETGSYVDKLAEILIVNNIRSLTVAFMEVPCCTGIVRIVKDALAASGKDIPLRLMKAGINGGIEAVN